MSKEDLNTQPAEVIANDNAILTWEQSVDVASEVDDTSAEVLRTVEKLNFLDKILWRISDPSNEIERLHEKRANDNDTETKKAA